MSTNQTDELANKDSSKKIINDVFGIGQGTESIAKSFGKLLEKIPSDKFSVGMAFSTVILIVYLIFIVTMFKINAKVAPSVCICIAIFIALCAGPFIFIEVKKEMLKIKNSQKK